MSGFWPWPAQIIQNIGKKRVRVKFFGDLTKGSVECKQCVPYRECGVLLRFYMQSIPVEKRNEYLERLHSEYNEETRSIFIKFLDRRAIYMQAIEDISLYLESKESMLQGLLSSIL